MSRARPHAVTIFVVAFAVVVLTWHSYNYYPFIADDTFISLRYTQRLLDGQGLTWTNGERVEGYSNLLWVLGCAAIGVLGIDLVSAARLLGWLSGVATISAIAFVAVRRRGEPRDLAPAVIATLSLATSGIIAVWTFGGLEQPLAAALIAWAHALALGWVDQDFAWSRRQNIWVGLLLGLLCWTRPDGPMFTATLLGALVIGSGFRRIVVRRCARAALISLGFCAAQLAFRLIYYGEWLANTAYAKLSWSANRREEGWKYLSEGLTGTLPILFLTAPLLIAILADARARKRALLLAASALTWCAYVVLIGGDIFPAHRHLVPLMALVALLVVESGRAACKWGAPARFCWLCISVTSLVVFSWVQWRDPDNQVGQGERWEWDAVATGRLLREQFGPSDALLAADVAGSLVYFSQLSAIDMLGLNDRYLAQHPPKTFGTGRLAHELGDGEYILNRNPDIVIFNAPTGDRGGVWRSGIEMGKSERFRRDYRYVTFETDDPHGLRTQAFIRLEGRVGIRRKPVMSIPGFFWGSSPDVTARIDREGRLGVVLRAGTSSKLEGIPLAKAPQTIAVHSSGEPVTVTVTCGDQSRSATNAALSTWDCGDPRGWSIELKSRGEGLTHVRDVECAPLSM
jgi:hypothetical protein